MRCANVISSSSLCSVQYSVVRALKNFIREEPTDQRIGHVGPSLFESVTAVQSAWVSLRLIHILGFFREKVSQAAGCGRLSGTVGVESLLEGTQ